jgi:hypothetical protein
MDCLYVNLVDETVLKKIEIISTLNNVQAFHTKFNRNQLCFGEIKHHVLPYYYCYFYFIIIIIIIIIIIVYDVFPFMSWV